jgi:Spy/CpxP family protein refolding chaperone
MTRFAGPLALALVLFAPASARAQAAPVTATEAVPTSSAPVLAALLQGIALTTTQRMKVDSILTHFRNQAPPLTPGTQPDSAMLQKFRDLSRQALDGVRSVLSKDQQQVWDRNIEAVRASTMRVGP